MVKHITDEFGSYTIAQMKVLIDWDYLREARNAEAELEIKTFEEAEEKGETITDEQSDIFEIRHQNFELEMKEITRRGLDCNLTAIAPAMINIGDTLISFKTWLGRCYIAFTEDDRRALCESKTMLLSSLISALRKQKRILYTQPHRVIVGDERITYLEPSSRAQFVDRCITALWIDLDSHTDKYLSNSDLINSKGLLDPRKYKDEPAPDDNLRVSGINVKIYNSFEQMTMTFEPIAPWEFEIYFLTELDTANAL